MSLPSARPRRASPGSRTQGRKKSSTGELPCHRVNKLAEVRPLKNTIGTNQSNSSLVFSSARKGEQCVGNATLEKTRKVGLGTSNVDDSRPTKVNAQIKDPTAAILKTKKMKDVVEDAASQLNEKTLEDGKLSLEVVKAAQSSGQLNLSEKGLENVPHQVWYLNEHEIKSKYASEGLFKDKIDEDDSWWARVDLSKLFLSSNRLCNISSDVEKLTTLLILDLHDNALHSIPSEIGKLGQLKKLDLSHNKLRQLPEEMFELRSLVYLDLSSNQLNSIQDSMNTLESLETLILSHNMLKFLPPSIGFIHKLEILNASNNKLSCLPGEISFLRNIKTLDVSRNELETTSDSLSGLQRLEIANLRHNRLAVMPQLKSCVELKELYVGNNLLSDITLEDIKHIPNVKTLELRDNKIAIIPNELILLQALERLDLANNNLTTLPHSLGMLPNLKSLPLEGNPFKALRRDIIQRGTMGILKYLKSRLTNDEITSFQKMVCSRGTSIQAMTNSDGVSSMSMPDKYAMQKVLVMDLSNRYLEIIPKDVVCDAIEVSVQRIDLSKNRFRCIFFLRCEAATMAVLAIFRTGMFLKS